MTGKGLIWLATVAAAIAAAIVITFFPDMAGVVPSPRSVATVQSDRSQSQTPNIEAVSPKVARVRMEGGATYRAPRVLEGNFPVPTGKATDVLAALELRAVQGDDEAAFSIYLKLMSCKRSAAINLDEHARAVYRRAGIEKSMLDKAESALDECSDLTAEQYQSAGRWLEAAAEKGLLVAQLSYAADPEAVVGNASEMLQSPEAVQQYKTKAMRYLNRAANGGNTDALRSLGNAYRAGVLVERDLMKSYAYYYAANRAYPSAYSDRFMAKFTRHLSAAQINEATNQGRKIYEQCCTP